MTFAGSIQAMVSRIGPYFVRNQQIGGFLQSVAMYLDTEVENLALGLRQAYPLKCDPSSLPDIANNRQIRLYPAESEASQRDRLVHWKDHHRQRACHIGELRHAQPYFLPHKPLMRIVHQDGLGQTATWHTIDGNGNYSRHRQSPSNWNWDNHPERWSRWWVIVYPPAEFLQPIYYGDGHHYGDGSRYYSAATSQMGQDMVNIFREWKASHSMLHGYIIATDENSFNPTSTAQTNPSGWTSLPAGNWAQPISSSGVRTRLPSAIWLLDKGIL